MEEYYEKFKDFCFKISDYLDGLSEKVLEHTGAKINFKIIIGTILLVIFAFILVKTTLGWVRGALMG